MTEQNETHLTIEVIPCSYVNIAEMAAELEKGLGEAATVQLTKKEIPGISIKGPAPGLIDVITVTIAALGTVIQLASLLVQNKKKSDGVLILVNPKTGKKVKITGAESLEQVGKKLRKVLKKGGWRLFSKK